VQDQIDANKEDAVKPDRSRLPGGEDLTHCEECEAVILFKHLFIVLY